MNPELRPWPRLVLALAAFGFLYFASPGIATPDGSWLLATIALALWAACASRPGKRAFWIEWLAASIGWAGICSWSAYVWWGTVFIMGPGMGLFMAAAGWALKRLARALPLALAAPAAWLLIEGVRSVLEPPFGLPWMRLGVHLHDQTWIVASARTWGSGGLSWVIAALGGLMCDLAYALVAGESRAPSRARRIATLAFGLGPLALGVLLARFDRAPRTVDGPCVLLVQPGIPQARKMKDPDRFQLFAESLDLTRRGIAEAERSGVGTPDLVAWGETMFQTPVVDPALAPAVRDGTARADPWSGLVLSVEDVLHFAEEQRQLIQALFGAGGVDGALPAGTSFASGAEFWTPDAARIRRVNAVALWNGAGKLEQRPTSKLHLVPGAETMLGLERFAFVRDVIHDLAGYVPDLLGPRDEPQTLKLDTRDGRHFEFGVSVCFDNAFEDPYTRPLRERGALDFHLVVSNEAWFRSSQEMDQMIAFSRIAAIETSRSVVRATNAGVTTVIAPDGREVARLRVGGKDREVPGTLAVRVPVPAPEDAGSIPLFVRSERAWRVFWILVPLALFATSRRRRGNSPSGSG